MYFVKNKHCDFYFLYIENIPEVGPRQSKCGLSSIVTTESICLCCYVNTT